jgi:predicted ATP-dependent endonuclease of OLD family
MKISKVILKDFKRFTDLTVSDLPETARLIVLVGPNGSGKTSLFEAFNYWYKLKGFGNLGEAVYYNKNTEINSNNNTDEVNVEFWHNPPNFKGMFYFRTAYRNEHDFTVNTFNKQNDPTQRIKLDTLMQNDITVSENYQRLISQALSEIFKPQDNLKTVQKLKEELIEKINIPLRNIFENLNLNSLGDDPIINGNFYFEKGTTKNFHYKNLSAGEKSVFDLLLDMIIKSKYYNDAVFCIDEPEAHIHTRLQAKVLTELYSLTPTNSQLWISTHSIGMIKQAEDLEKQNPNSVVFLDFNNKNFDSTENIYPAKIDKTIWNHFLDLALADFSQLICPEQIVFCEGTDKGKKCKNFDAEVYKKIFEQKHKTTLFVSIGSCTEIENTENPSIKIVSIILKSSKVLKFIDRDNRSDEEIKTLLLDKGIKTSKRRNLESYLLDDELIKKLCSKFKKDNLIEKCLNAKKEALQNSIRRGNPSDDIKSASGDIVNELKKNLDLIRSGNNTSAFIKDTMAPLVTEDTDVYKDLETEIFE